MQEFLERASLTTAPDKKTGRGMIQIIDPGWGGGSGCYYGAEVLAEAASNQVFKAGTRMFVDHPTESEKVERSERSVHDIAAVLTEDASVGDGGALIAPIQVVSKYRESLAELAELGAIGCSIRAGGFSEAGEADGRQGQIVTSLDECKSVDFVTSPGRGGKVLMLESDRVVLREASTNDTREAIDAALQDEYGGKDRYVWCRDFDPDNGVVWYETSGDTSQPGLWQQAYTVSADGSVALSGDRTEVAIHTTYVPVVPAGQSESQTPKEIPMGQIQLEESEHTRLTEAASRVTVLEAERDTAIRERDTEKARADGLQTTLDEAKAATARTDKARAIIATESTKTGATFTALESKGLLADLPVDDKGALVEATFTEAVTAACADVLKRMASGVHGFGARDPFQFDESATVTDADLTALDEAAFGPITQEA